MRRKSRIRTTSTESRHANRAARKLEMLRRQVAAEAARIMATEGQRNFRAAKQKAAERVGVNSRLALPSNLEVEDALRAYQSFYGGQAHDENLHLLREQAIRAMRALEAFSPRLVGPVLDGTADRHSRISLHLFADPPDAVVMHLIELGLPHRLEERRIRWHDGDFRTVTLAVTEDGGVTVEMALFERVDLRQAPPSPVDGRPQRRATISEVEALLAEDEQRVAGFV